MDQPETADEIDALRRRIVAAASGDAEHRGDSLELLRAILAHTPDSIATVTPSGRFLFLNRETEGFAPIRDETTIYDYLAPADHARIRACFTEVVRTGRPGTYESSAAMEDGTLRRFETRLGPIVERGRVIAVVMVSSDVTAAHARDVELRASEEKLRFAIDASGMGIWTFDVEADLIHLDDHLCAICGVAPGPARALADFARLVPVADRQQLVGALDRCVASGVYEDVEIRVRRPDGALVWLHTKGRSVRDPRGRVVQVVGGAFDVTAQVEEAARRDRAQKLEAVGQLAAGVAHNFNNALAAMQLNLEVALRRAPPEIEPLVRDVLDTGQRAAELVRELLRFAGRGSRGEAREVESLGGLVERVASLCRQTFPRDITVETAVAPELPPLRISVAAVEQLVLNLCINAQHALEDAPRERRWMRLELDLVDRGGPVLRLRVSDNGSGMDETTQARLFEPFFTTKEPGRGTGLGLATVYSTARDHGGSVACESRLGEGTVFSVFFPVTP